MAGGRPSKFTPEVADKILSKVRLGVFLKVAARYAGVTARTVYSWLKRGQRTGEGDRPYREFLHSYMVAAAEGRLILEESALGAGRLDGAHALKVLAQRWPEDWGTVKGEIRRMRKQLEEMAALMAGKGFSSDG